MRVSFVRFEDGAHSGWHSHRGGQIFLLMSGKGRVEARREAPIFLSPGDTVWTLPNEEHRQGAAEGQSMLQFTVTVDVTDWVVRSPRDAFEVG